jgi:hypothetical protein
MGTNIFFQILLLLWLIIIPFLPVYNEHPDQLLIKTVILVGILLLGKRND